LSTSPAPQKKRLIGFHNLQLPNQLATKKKKKNKLTKKTFSVVFC
jgi:hypothetical protein